MAFSDTARARRRASGCRAGRGAWRTPSRPASVDVASATVRGPSRKSDDLVRAGDLQQPATPSPIRTPPTIGSRTAQRGSAGCARAVAAPRKADAPSRARGSRQAGDPDGEHERRVVVQVLEDRHLQRGLLRPACPAAPRAAATARKLERGRVAWPPPLRARGRAISPTAPSVAGDAGARALARLPGELLARCLPSRPPDRAVTLVAPGPAGAAPAPAGSRCGPAIRDTRSPANRTRSRAGAASRIRRFDAAAALELRGGAMGHGGAIVDSRAVLIREVMTESVVTADPQQQRPRDRRADARAQRRLGRARGGRAPGRLHHRPRPHALRAGRRARPVASPAVDHASSPVITAAPDMELDEGADLMMRHGVRRLVVVEAGRLAAWSRSTTWPRAPATRARRRAVRARDARGHARLLLPRARRRLDLRRHRGPRERPDHRVRARAVAGQLGLEQRAEEERVVAAARARARRRRRRAR